MKTKSLIILCAAAVTLGACASNKGPERHPQVDKQRMARLYNTFISRWDFNEDGSATCDDISTQRSRLFRRLDEDQNGQLTSREYRHARFEDKSFMFFTVDRVDTNSNTTIDADEFVAVPHSQFLNMDQDNDCFIDQHEALTAMRERNPDAALQRRGNGSKDSRSKGNKRHFTAD